MSICNSEFFHDFYIERLKDLEIFMVDILTKTEISSCIEAFNDYIYFC